MPLFWKEQASMFCFLCQACLVTRFPQSQFLVGGAGCAQLQNTLMKDISWGRHWREHLWTVEFVVSYSQCLLCGKSRINGCLIVFRWFLPVFRFLFWRFGRSYKKERDIKRSGIWITQDVWIFKQSSSTRWGFFLQPFFGIYSTKFRGKLESS